METDLVIGCIYGYEYADIEPWAVSLKRSGYGGKVALIVFKGSDTLLKKLESEHIYVIAFSNANVDYGIMVTRFIAMSHFLKTDKFFKDVGRIITTDVKDVIFQENPSNLFNSLTEKYIVVGREGFTYENEPWSKNNMKLAFGDRSYDFMKNVPIICAGVIAGDIESMKNLFTQITILCKDCFYPNAVPGGGGPDQAALNIILETPKWKWCVYYSERILHAGTSLPGILNNRGGEIGRVLHEISQGNPDYPKEYYKGKFLLQSDPKLIDGKIIDVSSADDKPYVIVHQYDRITEWNAAMKKKYKECQFKETQLLVKDNVALNPMYKGNI